jgi:hypothetical protein
MERQAGCFREGRVVGNRMMSLAASAPELNVQMIVLRDGKTSGKPNPTFNSIGLQRGAMRRDEHDAI